MHLLLFLLLISCQLIDPLYCLGVFLPLGHHDTIYRRMEICLQCIE